MIVHLLNYRVPIGRANADQVEAVGPMEMSLPLPEAGTVRAARAWSPERTQLVTLKFAERGQTLRLTLPTLRIYELCEISFRR